MSTISVKAGRYYKTKEGSIVGPMMRRDQAPGLVFNEHGAPNERPGNSGVFVWVARFGTFYRSYTSNGGSVSGTYAAQTDLVEELPMPEERMLEGLNIRVGGTYVTRSGLTVKITGLDNEANKAFRFSGKWIGVPTSRSIPAWYEDGRYYSDIENPLDLVKEVAEAPVPSGTNQIGAVDDVLGRLMKQANDGMAAFKEIAKHFPGWVEARYSGGNVKPVVEGISMPTLSLAQNPFKPFDVAGIQVNLAPGRKLRIGCQTVSADKVVHAVKKLKEVGGSFFIEDLKLLAGKDGVRVQKRSETDERGKLITMFTWAEAERVAAAAALLVG